MNLISSHQPQKLRKFLKAETKPGGRLEYKKYVYVLGETWIEYQATIPYWLKDEFDWMMKNVTARYNEFSKLLG